MSIADQEPRPLTEGHRRSEPEPPAAAPDRGGGSANPLWQRLALGTEPAVSEPSDPLEQEAERVAAQVAGEQPGPIPGDVRVHTGPDAARAAESVGARAFTVGSEVVFGAGEYAPDTHEGRRLLAHELAHVEQQRDGRAAEDVVRRRPAELLDNVKFLGVTIEGGINTTMRDRLKDVQDDLQKVYDALGPKHPDRIHFGGAPKTLGEWSEVRSVRGWRKGSNTSKHSSGSAVDINYDMQPYMVTRSVDPKTGKTVLGGEVAGAGLAVERQNAVTAYDRASQFALGSDADVSMRRTGETTAAVYARFSQLSQALSQYFRLSFFEEPTRVLRMPVKDIETVAEADLLAAIPTTERRPEAEAVALLTTWMDADWRKRHPTWTLTPRETYIRMLRDYEHVRIPMVRGNPVARPADTRNPARGFLYNKPEVVQALVDVGNLRWGVSDFGITESGDIHHFDLGNHGGVVPDGEP